jgi:hypothetical protein
MEDVGFWKKKGCFGRALLSSVIWSLIQSQQAMIILFKLSRYWLLTHNCGQCR